MSADQLFPFTNLINNITDRLFLPNHLINIQDVGNSPFDNDFEKSFNQFKELTSRSYLHEECQKKIIHYDVKADNVLLDDSLTPKLTDFGIAQLLSRADVQASVHALRGTRGYMAPEVIHVGTAPITGKCDVYSFGMLLFELIGRRRNMDNGAVMESQRWLPLLAWTMYEQGKLLDLVKECHYPVAAADQVQERWKETAERMCKVAFLCVQEQPEARPTMSMVVNMLEGHMEIPPPVYPFGWMYSQSQEALTGSGSKSEVFIRIDT